MGVLPVAAGAPSGARGGGGGSTKTRRIVGGGTSTLFSPPQKASAISKPWTTHDIPQAEIHRCFVRIRAKAGSQVASIDGRARDDEFWSISWSLLTKKPMRTTVPMGSGLSTAGR